MNVAIVAALISVGGTILIFILGKVPWNRIRSKQFRSRHNIPDIVPTQWNATWYDEQNQPYVTDDRVEFRKWTKGNRFAGNGDMTCDLDGNPRRYRYPIEGEVSPQRIVILSYRAQGYPTEANIGMACLELSNSANELQGWWAGRGSKTEKSGKKYQTIRFGSVKMIKTG